MPQGIAEIKIKTCWRNFKWTNHGCWFFVCLFFLWVFEPWHKLIGQSWSRDEPEHFNPVYFQGFGFLFFWVLNLSHILVFQGQIVNYTLTLLSSFSNTLKLESVKPHLFSDQFSFKPVTSEVQLLPNERVEVSIFSV